MNRLKLGIEPVPASFALATLAKLLPRPEWDAIRRGVYRRARYRCEICGTDGRLHCHEVWHCNERTGYQWLMGFQAVCADCHAVKHLLNERDPRRVRHLGQHFVTVNKTDAEAFRTHLRQARRRQTELDAAPDRWQVSFGQYAFRVPALKNREQRKKYLGLERDS